MNDAVLQLTKLGLTAYEAKAYLALLQKNPVIGYEVSKLAGIPTAKVYETLLSLRNKGIVLASTTEPVMYSPIDPQMLLNRARSDFDAKIDTLTETLTKVSPVPEFDITWNLAGMKCVYEKMTEVIRGAAKELLVSLWPQEAAAVSSDLAEAQSRGVRVIAAIFGSFDRCGFPVVNLETCGASASKRLQKRLNVVAGDSKEVVISESGSDGSMSGIWTTTPCIVLTAKEYIKHDIWGKALIGQLGEDRFSQMCADSDVLSYLIANR